MVPSCCLWKVVTFFGKEHVDWFSISGVMVGRSWTIKSIIFLVNFSKLDFLTSSSDKSLILDQLTCYLPKNVTTFHGEQDGIIHFCLSPNKMGIFDTLNLHFDKKKWIFPNLIFQLHPIITSLILDQLACSLPKSNTTFHQIFKYVKKGANFPFFEWENSKYIFGRRSSIETVYALFCKGDFSAIWKHPWQHWHC